MMTIGGIIIGVVICASTGYIVKKILDLSVQTITLTPPDGISQDDWDSITNDKKIRGKEKIRG